MRNLICTGESFLSRNFCADVRFCARVKRSKEAHISQAAVTVIGHPARQTTRRDLEVIPAWTRCSGFGLFAPLRVGGILRGGALHRAFPLSVEIDKIGVIDA